MTELSDYERATVERIEAAPAAEESLRERVARAIHDGTVGYVQFGNCADHEDAWRKMHSTYLRNADAAIAVMRGEL